MGCAVSVIIPVYNEEAYLRQCLDSVLGQSLQEIEVLCIDDGSTDNSKAILDEYQKADSRVRVLKQYNQGSGIARNSGIQFALGEYISFLDSDDYFCGDCSLEKLYKAAKSNGALVAGGQLLHDIHTDITVRPLPLPKNLSDDGQYISFNEYQNSFGYQIFIFSRKMLQENQIRFPSYLRYQDPPFLARALFTAKQYFMLPIPFYAYRMGHKVLSWTSDKVNDMVKGLIDNLLFSSEHGLAQLHRATLEYCDVNCFRIILDSLALGNAELLHLLLKANDIAKVDILGCEDYHISMPFKLQVLQHITADIYGETLARIASAEKIVYCIAGNKGRGIISQAKNLQGIEPDIVWDIYSGNIEFDDEQAAFLPDFSLLRKDWVLILCVDSPAVVRSIRLSCEARGFHNILDWIFVQGSWLNKKYKDVLLRERNCLNT